ncbi:hypothetical protein SAMN05421595_1375 [Austwickia chelonae]|uniref:Uncharacterized protein n=1 Tax=Austwickia chelonae NBRC 105200 TaxID=1184607 RepID=K6V5R3_9MICO|nr:hypothetical protein [Austwickia chelonae]GAB77538.1 hypothetical protein AUCHE_05_04500 [Austwickia chelonae NBRC 105200]SEW12433.1 hypothetical protein SAMN05421595_1375 [Austwickia chelonae]
MEEDETRIDPEIKCLSNSFFCIIFVGIVYFFHWLELFYLRDLSGVVAVVFSCGSLGALLKLRFSLSRGYVYAAMIAIMNGILLVAAGIVDVTLRLME